MFTLKFKKIGKINIRNWILGSFIALSLISIDKPKNFSFIRFLNDDTRENQRMSQLCNGGSLEVNRMPDLWI